MLKKKEEASGMPFLSDPQIKRKGKEYAFKKTMGRPVVLASGAAIVRKKKRE